MKTEQYRFQMYYDLIWVDMTESRIPERSVRNSPDQKMLDLGI